MGRGHHDARRPERRGDAKRADVIVAIAPQPARAAKNATSEIPIVMLYVADPVGVGLAQSLARPGGNLTGWRPSCRVPTPRKTCSFLESFCPQRGASRRSSTLRM